MKKLKLAAGAVLVLATVGTANAQGDNRSATVAILETIPEVCNIGLATTGSDGGVGVSGLSTQYHDTGEISLVNGVAIQSITGGVKCNAANGYEVNVNVAYGVLKHQTNPNESVAYNLEIAPAGYTPHKWDVVPSTLGLVNTTNGAPGAFKIGKSTALEEIQFKLEMHGMDFSAAPAGSYSETVTFSITTL